MLGKSVGSNLGVRAASPGTVNILSEIPALDLGGERGFRFGHNCLVICLLNCLLSVGRIDGIGAHQAEHNAKSSCRKSLIDIGSPHGRPRFGPISASLTKAAGSGGRAYVFPHGTTKWTIKAAAIMRIRNPAAATITVSRMKRLPKGTPAKLIEKSVRQCLLLVCFNQLDRT